MNQETQVALAEVTHKFYFLNDKQSKNEIILDYLKMQNVRKTIIFGNEQNDRLVSALKQNFTVQTVHSRMNLEQRETVFRDFLDNKTNCFFYLNFNYFNFADFERDVDISRIDQLVFFDYEGQEAYFKNIMLCAKAGFQCDVLTLVQSKVEKGKCKAMLQEIREIAETEVIEDE
ncbi:Helicase [Hexamita inflata]|uniref:C-terminal n=1 Tax=Hexamita inflata TaxID=28002 RepID=A0AA86QMY8_9EUKA|nr:C-terminal [Hexamita inflata]